MKKLEPNKEYLCIKTYSKHRHCYECGYGYNWDEIFLEKGKTYKTNSESQLVLLQEPYHSRTLIMKDFSEYLKAIDNE